MAWRFQRVSQADKSCISSILPSIVRQFHSDEASNSPILPSRLSSFRPPTIIAMLSRLPLPKDFMLQPGGPNDMLARMFKTEESERRPTLGTAARTRHHRCLPAPVLAHQSKMARDSAADQSNIHHRPQLSVPPLSQVIDGNERGDNSEAPR
ncbi:MAG: hypothetical protein Q9184_004925 [Pyrenodesmia sp. 2 TL-2023]